MCDTATRCKLPDDAVVTAEVEFVLYLTAESSTAKFAVRVGPDAPASTLLGLIEMGKHKVLHEAEEEWK